MRKSKREIVEMITVWAAIESMAARLAAPRVTEAELGELHALVDAFQEDPSEQLSEYSAPTWSSTRRSSAWAAWS